MAIYHTSIKTVSRGKGHSSVAAAAYRAGLLLVEERTGVRHDYRRRSGVVQTMCFVPEHAPDWTLSPDELWTAAEASERRRDAVVAREFVVALPHELTDDERGELVREIARSLVHRYGFAIQASIHEPGMRGGLNHHVHLLATTRRIGTAGLMEKTRELDGGAPGRVEVRWVREMVASTINRHLAAAGHEDRVDHRSLADQAADALSRGDLAAAAILSRAPTIHLGKNAAALESRGAPCDLADANARTTDANEAAFAAALARFEIEGRAVPVPYGHTHAQAKRDRNSPEHLDESVEASSAPDSCEAELEEAWRGARLKLAEAREIWSEVWMAPYHEMLSRTRELLDRGREFLSSDQLIFAVRDGLARLVLLLDRLKDAALGFARAEAQERRAARLLASAEASLEDFAGKHPKPGDMDPVVWARSRGQLLTKLSKRFEALKLANEALTPQAEAEFDRQAQVVVGALETHAESMLAGHAFDLAGPSVQASVAQARNPRPSP